MIYIKVKASEIEQANQWVVDNCDPEGAETFIDNMDGACIISLPDNGSQYTELMKEHFGYSETMEG